MLIFRYGNEFGISAKNYQSVSAPDYIVRCVFQCIVLLIDVRIIIEVYNFMLLVSITFQDVSAKKKNHGRTFAPIICRRIYYTLNVILYIILNNGKTLKFCLYAQFIFSRCEILVGLQIRLELIGVQRNHVSIMQNRTGATIVLVKIEVPRKTSKRIQ